MDDDEESNWLLSPWMHKLREGDWVSLVKADAPGDRALVAAPWQMPNSGGWTGRIFLDIFRDNRRVGTDRWYVDPYGAGFDGVPLLRPRCKIEELLARPDPQLTTSQETTLRLRRLTARVERLERILFDRAGISPPPIEVALGEDVEPTNRRLDRRPNQGETGASS